MMQKDYLHDEVFNQPLSKIRPDEDTVHKVSIEFVKVLEKGVSNLREAIFGVVWLIKDHKYLFRSLEDAIDRAHGNVVKDSKDVGYQNEFKQMFRNKIFYTTGAYSYRGGQFAVYPEIVDMILKYQTRYRFRNRFLGPGTDPFSDNFPQSFWKKENKSESNFPGTRTDERNYSVDDLDAWYTGSYRTQPYRPPPVPDPVHLTVVKNNPIQMPSKSVTEETQVTEEPKLTKHQEEKNARRKKEYEFAVLCFNALRYNDSTAVQCLLEALWYNADKGQQYIVQSAAKKSGSSTDFILAMIEQYYIERFLAVGEVGPIIDKEIKGEIKNLLISGVGKNGVRLIKGA